MTLYGVYDRWQASNRQQEQFEEQRNRWTKQFEEERKRWTEEFEAGRRDQQVLVKRDFHLEQYRYRVAAYADVLKTLGAVSDVTYVQEGPEKYRALHENRELLQSAADELYQHLYGKAGLLMTMTTRNVLHGARRACLAFAASDGDKKDGDNLVNAFYYARRYLRADLELSDDRSPERLKDLVDQIAAEDRRA